MIWCKECDLVSRQEPGRTGSCYRRVDISCRLIKTANGIEQLFVNVGRIETGDFKRPTD